MPETKPTKNHTKNMLRIFSYIFFSIYTIFAIILSVILIRVPILPLKYFLPIIMLLTILDILFIFFLFRKSTKIVTSLVCIVFEIVFTALIGFALFYLGTTISFFNSIKPQTSIDLPEKTDFDITKDPFNLYISGIDTYGEITTVSRSDVNIVVTVNPRTHTVLLTTVPRDYEVQLHGTTGLKDKLTHAGLYGVEMSIKTIEDLLNIDISYYLRINFDSTIKLIDALGGVEITPDATFYKSKYNCYFRAGVTMHLDGGCALTYARERKTYEFGDLHRIENQQDILSAVIEKLTTSKTLLTNYVNILASLSDSIETNIPSDQFYRFINMQLDTMPSWTIERNAVEGTEIHVPTYTYPNQDLFVFQQNPESIKEASIKIDEVLAAE